MRSPVDSLALAQGRSSTIAAGQQIARRMILRIADDGDAAAVGAHGVALGHGVDRVVGALAVHVGLQQLEQRRDRRLAKRSRRSRRRAARPPAPRDRLAAAPAATAPSARAPTASSLIATISRSASRFAAFEVADVADVQQIEAAVGERDASARARGPAATRSTSVGAIEDLTHARRCPADVARTARRSSAADTVAVPRFITTRPPA